MIRLGLIGCGSIGRTHAECVAKIDGAAFAAYADVRAEAAETLLADFGGDYATAQPQRVLADDGIDAVYIATRHDSHAALAMAAARAGKHILLEKPLAMTLEDCERIAEAVETHGVFLMPAFKLRYYPLVQRAREFVPHPQVLVGQVMDNRWGDDHWAQDPVTGGANVHSQGCHAVDLLRFLAGSEPVRLAAAGGAITHPGHPCIDQCVASVEFANGAVAAWIQGDAAQGAFTSKFFFELFGDGKCVQLHDRVRKATFSDGKDTWTEQRPEEEGFQLENEEFLAALKQGRPPALTVHDGIQAERMVLAADRAIRTGEVQHLAE